MLKSPARTKANSSPTGDQAIECWSTFDGHSVGPECRRQFQYYTGARMTITVELKPEVERELAHQAAARGMDVPAYAATLLEQAAQPPVPEPQARPKRPRPPGRKSLAQLFAESPFRGLDLDFEREPDLGRDI